MFRIKVNDLLFKSFRYEIQGSVFIQSVCKVFLEHAKNRMLLVDMLNRVALEIKNAIIKTETMDVKGKVIKKQHKQSCCYLVGIIYNRCKNNHGLIYQDFINQEEIVLLRSDHLICSSELN